MAKQPTYWQWYLLVRKWRRIPRNMEVQPMVRGVFRKTNGEVFDGEIKNGKFNGYGKLFWSNSKWFEGIFVDGKPYNGMLFTVDGKISEYKDGEQL